MTLRKPDEFITTIDHATPAQLHFLWQTLFRGRWDPSHGTLRRELYRQGVFWVAYKTNPSAHNSREDALVRNVTPVATGSYIARLAAEQEDVKSCKLGRLVELEGDQAYTLEELPLPLRASLCSQLSGRDIPNPEGSLAMLEISKALQTLPAEKFVYNARLGLWRWVEKEDTQLMQPLPHIGQSTGAVKQEPEPRSPTELRAILKDGEYSDLTQGELRSIADDPTDFFDSIEKELADKAWQQEEQDRVLIAMGR